MAMGVGGRREGAGRKPGVPNKVTAKERAERSATGETPLDYMLRIMRESTDPARQDRMAAAAAPYMHARLTTSTMTGPGGGPIQVEQKNLTDESRAQALANFITRLKK